MVSHKLHILVIPSKVDNIEIMTKFLDLSKAFDTVVIFGNSDMD